MQLPGRLRDTTLGDLLGALHRSRTTGGLELIECVGQNAGRHHVIQLVDGVIVGVQSDSPSFRLGDFLDVDADRVGHILQGEEQNDRLGEALLSRGLLTRAQLKSALDRQLRCRLEQLFRLPDAQLRFRAPRPLPDDPTAPAPMGRADFLHGRPRARNRGRDSGHGGDRGAAQQPAAFAPKARASRRTPPHPGASHPGASHPGASRRSAEALAVLGLPDGATQDQVKTAFRKLARQLHPDRHPDASPERRVQLLRRFSELSRAFHALAN